MALAATVFTGKGRLVFRHKVSFCNAISSTSHATLYRTPKVQHISLPMGIQACSIAILMLLMLSTSINYGESYPVLKNVTEMPLFAACAYTLI